MSADSIIAGWQEPAVGSPTLAMPAISDPASISNTTGLMCGLGIAVTPTGSTALVIISGMLSHSGDGGVAHARVYYGTGTAPSNGAALPGSGELGGWVSSKSTAAGDQHSYSRAIALTGLTPGTPYWVDVALKFSNAGGSASLASLLVVTQA